MVRIARQLNVDTARQARISGTTDWQGQSYTITGSGTHTLKWRYTKNGSGTGGSDCAWVDYVQGKIGGRVSIINYSSPCCELRRLFISAYP